jgi:hypothetical protein
VWSLAGITTADKKSVHSIAQKQKIYYNDQSSNQCQVGGSHRGIFNTKTSHTVVAPSIPGWQLGKLIEQGRTFTTRCVHTPLDPTDAYLLE